MSGFIATGSFEWYKRNPDLGEIELATPSSDMIMVRGVDLYDEHALMFEESDRRKTLIWPEHETRRMQFRDPEHEHLYLRDIMAHVRRGGEKQLYWVQCQNGNHHSFGVDNVVTIGSSPGSKKTEESTFNHYANLVPTNPAGGVRTNFTVTRRRYLPRFEAVIRMPFNTTNFKLFFGLSSQQLDNNNDILQPPPGHIGFRYNDVNTKGGKDKEWVATIRGETGDSKILDRHTTFVEDPFGGIEPRTVYKLEFWMKDKDNIVFSVNGNEWPLDISDIDGIDMDMGMLAQFVVEDELMQREMFVSRMYLETK